MINLTIGALESNFKRNGTPITPINSKDDLEKVRLYAQGKEKESLPVLTTYRGVRGEYLPSNVFFVDIDTTEGVDKIINNISLLFNYLPNIYFVQRSYSKKLHICGCFNKEIETPEEWSNLARVYTAATIHIINKLYGIDYSRIESGVDTHSFGYYQLLYVSADPIIFNDNLNPITFGQSDVDNLFKEYPLFKPAKKITVNKSGKLTGRYEYGESTNKLCVDRNLKIGEFSGNEVRWRISKIAVEIFGDDAKEWCDKYFYYDNGKSIFSNTRDNIGIHHSVLNWLVANKYLTIKEVEERPQTLSNYTEVEMDSPYLSSYVDTICEYIEKENVLTVYAPTGAGKTTCISGCVKNERNRSVKLCEGIVDKYPNSIVLVPFNVTNNLYDSMNIVSSETNNQYKMNKPNVMIWDQFNKIASTIHPDVVIVDESHTLFLDRTYRDSAVETINVLYNYLQRGIKIVFVSATPAGEVKIFNSYVLRFKKKDERDIKIDFCTVNDTFTCILKDIRRGGFDKICVFSDRDAKLLYANCLNEGIDNVTIYHSDFTRNLDDLRKDEKINNRISFLTCIAFNGLNIRNTNEKILIDIRLTSGETSYNEIIQIIGRFRNNKDITVRLYADNKYAENVDLDMLFNDAKVIAESNSIEVNNDYWERMDDSNVQDALQQIESFYKSQDILSIVGMLKKDYPINVINGIVKKEDIVARRNPYKREASDLFRDQRAGVEYNTNDKMILDYIYEWTKRIEELACVYPDIWSLIDKLLGNNRKVVNTLVSTVIDKAERIVRLSCISEDEWKEEVAKRKLILKDIKNPNLIKSLVKRFKENDNIREKYKGLVELGTLQYEIEDIDFDSIIESRSCGGKKGGETSKRNKRLLYEGIEYDSCQQLADAVGKRINTVTNWIKKGKVLEIK